MMTNYISKNLAIAKGEPFSKKEFAPYQNLSSYLQNTVNLLPEAKVIQVGLEQEDAITTTYLEIWHSATCLLTYLRKKGVKPCDRIIPIAQNSIPRTVSGKIQKNKLVEQLKKGKFDSVINNIEEKTNQQLEKNFVAPKTEI